MRILVTNDDGVYSPALACLARTAAAFGQVRVVAPDVEQSSMGQAITASRPLSCRPAPLPSLDAWRVNGTPSDCVALGTHLWDRVDVVLSGINLGSNLGNSIWHSGTLAAAKQAALLGIRGIALSMPVPLGDPDFTAIEPHVRAVLELLLPASDLTLANVNFPANPRGIRWTRVSVRHYDGRVVASEDPMGRPIYWFTVVALERAEEGTDRRAVEDGYVSITPLRLDLTDEAKLEEKLRLASNGTGSSAVATRTP
jgi:5'-nucleotidase